MVTNDTDTRKTLNLSGPKPAGTGTLELKKKIDLGRRSEPGRKTVTVEVKRRRGGEGLKPVFTPAEGLARPRIAPAAGGDAGEELRSLTRSEQAARLQALRKAGPQERPAAADEELRVLRKVGVVEEAEPEAIAEPVEDAVAAEPPYTAAETVADGGQPAETATQPEPVAEPAPTTTVVSPPDASGIQLVRAVPKPAPVVAPPRPVRAEEPLRRLVRRFEEPIVVPPKPAEPEKRATAAPATGRAVAPAPAVDDDGRVTRGKADPRKVEVAPPKRGDDRRQRKLTITTALSSETEEERQRSLASVKRRREKEKQRLRSDAQDKQKIVREVILPEIITVQELANRMAEPMGAVVKTLMKMGVMATATQTIDPDTAELVATELGHTVKRVSEADVEIGLGGAADMPGDLRPRPPVVTIMGHVDHGKTTLLDALRSTDVAAHEAGGITQHIGAYQVRLEGGQAITFVDTPGHAAFTEMRARGANVTDIVVLVVAADDGVMPQTAEAIAHAKAAGVPIIVAINKMDKPDANPNRVMTELLSHELVVEQMGGDIQAIEVSALARKGLDKLEEAILLQADILDLKANPDRAAEGTVIEARLDIGRGPVATVLVQRGTLSVGDIFVAGGEWGRVRALLDERNQRLTSAGPSVPVEVLGLQGTPLAGDPFVVVESEARAREVSDFRQRRLRQKTGALVRGSVEQMFFAIGDNAAKQLAVVVKTDVHGSLEAIRNSLEKLSTDEVSIRVLHSGVGSITESDIGLARASNAVVIGFNVRANPQAREVSARDKIEIRYYSIIYNLIDDIKALASGLLAPNMQETFLGYAEIRQVFNITKVGKVAGCYVTDGVIERGCGVRLLRDNVVIHEGKLKTLKRIKDEVKEVKAGFECGMAFENYQDIREGDRIECFKVESVARSL